MNWKKNLAGRTKMDKQHRTMEEINRDYNHTNALLGERSFHESQIQTDKATLLKKLNELVAEGTEAKAFWDAQPAKAVEAEVVAPEVVTNE